MIKSRAFAVVVSLCSIVAYTVGSIGEAQVVEGQAVDANGAPQYIVDPFWPKPLPNRWSMQQVVGIWVDDMEHVWFLNRGRGALPIELAAEPGPKQRFAACAGRRSSSSIRKATSLTPGAVPDTIRCGRRGSRP